MKEDRNTHFYGLRGRCGWSPYFLLTGRNVLIADAPATVRVVSAFAQRGAKADLQRCHAGAGKVNP
jgi:hypothetical protein